VLAEPTGTGVDRPNVGTVRLDDGVHAVARDIDANYRGGYPNGRRLTDETADLLAAKTGLFAGVGDDAGYIASVIAASR
jgi:hypothetical protein